MYIDDEASNLNGFKYSFYGKYEIFTALSADKGMDILNDHSDIKVIICDQRMPEKTGLEFFKEVSEKFPDVIRIILSAYADAEIIMEAINEGGIYRYITKPWNKNELQVTIENAIEAYNLKNENKSLLDKLIRKNKELEDSLNMIKESEEKFKNIFNSSTDGIMISDFTGKILEMNNASLKHLGMSEADYKNADVTQFLDLQQYDLVMKRREMFQNNQYVPPIEVIIKKKSGEVFPAEVNSKVIKYLGDKAILSIVRDITERKNVERNILKTIVETEEKERKRFADDLHDGIGPLLSTLKLYFNSLDSKSRAESDKQKMLKNAGEIIDELIETVKSISNHLMPHILNDFGLDAALSTYISKIKETGVIAIHYDFNPEVMDLDKNIEIVIYRIICELINNTLKYAGAKKIHINIRMENEHLMVFYADDGKGFDVERSLEKKTANLGMKNLIYRVRSLEGQVRFDNNKDKGFQVTIVMPVKKAE